MPTYVYRRPDGTTFDVFQKISAPALTEDPETGVPVQRVISGGAGLQFKGDGFYITDYKNKPSESKPAGKKAESKAGSSSSEAPSKPETKPATTAPAASSGGGDTSGD